MVCKKCGTVNSEGSKYCEECGEILDNKELFPEPLELSFSSLLIPSIEYSPGLICKTPLDCMLLNFSISTCRMLNCIKKTPKLE